MNSKSNVIISRTLFLLSLQLSVFMSFSQQHYTTAAVKLTIAGTSSLHDWDMQSLQGTADATFTVNAAGQISGLTALNFSTPATALKSEHSGLDKNAYKALKTDKNPTISYTLVSAVVTPAAGGTSIVRCNGRLTIAGTTVNTDLEATCKINPDKSITVTGLKKIAMKDYKVDPPVLMLGAIKTGNDITLNFNLTLNNKS